MLGRRGKRTMPRNGEEKSAGRPSPAWLALYDTDRLILIPPQHEFLRVGGPETLLDKSRETRIIARYESNEAVRIVS